MKIKMHYMTNERISVRPGVSTYPRKMAQLEAIQFFRRPCGSGAASSRYFYSALFLAPEDAFHPYDNKIVESVDRKLNPHFDPKKLTWVDNVATPA